MRKSVAVVVLVAVVARLPPSPRGTSGRTPLRTEQPGTQVNKQCKNKAKTMRKISGGGGGGGVAMVAVVARLPPALLEERPGAPLPLEPNNRGHE